MSSLIYIALEIDSLLLLNLAQILISNIYHQLDFSITVLAVESQFLLFPTTMEIKCKGFQLKLASSVCRTQANRS